MARTQKLMHRTFDTLGELQEFANDQMHFYRAEIVNIETLSGFKENAHGKYEPYTAGYRLHYIVKC